MTDILSHHHIAVSREVEVETKAVLMRCEQAEDLELDLVITYPSNHECDRNELIANRLTNTVSVHKSRYCETEIV